VVEKNEQDPLSVSSLALTHLNRPRRRPFDAILFRHSLTFFSENDDSPALDVQLYVVVQVGGRSVYFLFVVPERYPSTHRLKVCDVVSVLAFVFYHGWPNGVPRQLTPWGVCLCFCSH